MRNKVELLKLLRENLHSDLFESGLCSLITYMFFKGLITIHEHYCLDKLIYKHKPKKYEGELYYFRKGKIENRDKYLQELIEKYKHD